MSTLQVGKRPHYLIVGGGIAGCSLAYELSKHELDITLIEAGKIAEQGASSVPVALLNPNRGRTARASGLDKKGLNAMHLLAQELEGAGLDHGIHFSGVLRIAHNEKQRKKFAKLAGVKQLDSQDVLEPYHAPFGGILIEQGGWLEPDKLLKALQKCAERRGARFIEGCKVEATRKMKDGSILVINSKKDKVVDKVFLCIGATHNPALGLPDLERLEGDVIALSAELGLPYPIAGAVYGMQKAKQIFMGGNHRLEHEDDPEAIQRLQKSSSWFLKALKDAPLTQTWSGLRAKQEDNQPLIKELEPDVWFFGALGGRGFLCSYYLVKNLSSSLT